MAKNFPPKSYLANYKAGGTTKADFLPSSKKTMNRIDGEDKFLVKMTVGGMMDMTDMVTAKYGKQTKKMGMMKKAKTGGYKNY